MRVPSDVVPCQRIVVVVIYLVSSIDACTCPIYCLYDKNFPIDDDTNKHTHTKI